MKDGKSLNLHDVYQHIDEIHANPLYCFFSYAQRVKSLPLCGLVMSHGARHPSWRILIQAIT